MKNNILLTLFLSLFVVSTMTAQEMDVEPSVKIKNEKFEAAVGGRFMTDAAYYNTQYTQMRSGFAIADARVRALLNYEKWSFFVDFDFSSGKFIQKDVYLKYDFSKEAESGSALKLGFYAEPTSMSRNTSLYGYHFFTRPDVVNALSKGRSLGLSYNYYTNRLLLHQGIFAENSYNNQEFGFQGVSLSGRWLFKPINDEDKTLHIGLGVRYAGIKTGKVHDGLLKTNYHIGTPLNTFVDRTNIFVNAELPWVKSVFDIQGELLFVSRNIFARGEYLYKSVQKQRPDRMLFENQLGGIWSWTTLESWQKGNPIRTNKFSGGYVELGVLLSGDGYNYSNANGVIEANKGKALEVVARYSHTNLNDIVAGEKFLYGKKKFFAGGVISDYPPVSTSVAGGVLHSVTLGLNYSFNRHAQFMIDYTYSRLDNFNYPMDQQMHTLQSRMMFTF